MRKYQLPDFLNGVLSQGQYERWLRRKASTHVRRDKKRGNLTATAEGYKVNIHQAVFFSSGADAYTGEQLDWSLLSKYDNIQSKAKGRKYKKRFALLPSVDHVADGLGAADFKICAWRTNDAKNGLPYFEFVRLCRLIVAEAARK